MQKPLGASGPDLSPFSETGTMSFLGKKAEIPFKNTRRPVALWRSHVSREVPKESHHSRLAPSLLPRSVRVTCLPGGGTEYARAKAERRNRATEAPRGP